MTKREEDITVERVQLKPEWLDSSAPVRRYKLHFYAFFILIIVVLSTVIFFSGGNLKRLISLSLITWISIGLLYTARKEVKKIENWKKIDSANKKRNLPLKRTSSMVERALKGRVLSQVIVEKRIRKAFIEKIKDVKSLSEKELKTLLKEPHALKKLVGDETISNFLMTSKRIRAGDVIQKKDEESLNFEIEQAEGERQKGETYKRKMKNVMEKISNWEGNR